MAALHVDAGARLPIAPSSPTRRRAAAVPRKSLRGIARPLLHLFDVRRGSPLEDYGVRCLILGAVANVPFAIYLAFLGVMQGSGTTRTALLISTVSVFLVQIPVGLGLGFAAGLGATGVWWSLPAANLVRVAMALAAHHRGQWAATGVGPPDRG
ncbi:MAG TPA: hypothetical protein VKB80_28405 [Kofleriaceae bacterium]|nr:hypothetical protein [Kofleriaceae bacterium]